MTYTTLLYQKLSFTVQREVRISHSENNSFVVHYYEYFSENKHTCGLKCNVDFSSGRTVSGK